MLRNQHFAVEKPRLISCTLALVSSSVRNPSATTKPRTQVSHALYQSEHDEFQQVVNTMYITSNAMHTILCNLCPSVYAQACVIPVSVRNYMHK